MQFPFRSAWCVAFLFVLVGCGEDDTLVRARADAVFMKAKAAIARGDHAEGRRLLQQTVLLDRQLDNAARLAEASLLLGENYSAAAEFDSALTLFREANVLYSQVADKPGMRAATLAIATVHRTRGEDQHAYEFLRDALRLDEALGEREGVQTLKWSLIRASRSLGDPETEQRLLKELLLDATTARDTIQLAKVHWEAGISSLQRHDYETAVNGFQRCASFAKMSNDSLLVIEALNRLAITYERQGRTAEAFQTYSQALRRTDFTNGAQQLRCEMLMRVGNAYVRQRRFAEARKFFNVALRNAIQISNRLVEAYALLHLGHCAMETPGGQDEARAMYRSAAGLLEDIGLPAAEAYGQWCGGNGAMKNGAVKEAIRHFRRAAALRDSSLLRPDEFDLFGECERVYADLQRTSATDILIDALLESGNTDEALQYARQKNRRAMFDAYNQLEIQTRSERLTAALSAVASARGNYRGAERRLAEVFSARSDSRALVSDVRHALRVAAVTLHEKSDSLASAEKQFRIALSPPNELDVKPSLPENAALVEYVTSRRSLYTFITTSQSSTVQLSAIERSQVVGIMSDYNTVLRKRIDETNPRALQASENHIKELSTKLYSTFLRSVETSVPPGTSLLIILPCDLPMIPLHALQKDGKRGEFAIERFSLRYLSDVDAVVLHRARMNTPLSESSLLQSVVTFGNQGISLWDVEYDLRDISGFFKDIRQYFNRTATIAALQNEAGDVLHLALDIHARERKPENSFIILSDGKSDRAVSYVRFGQLFGIAPFSTVILSNVNDEQLQASVPRIFLMNGSADVVMNSYMPTRKAKKIFNELFYTELMAGNSTEVSYRNTLLKMLNDPQTASPRLWSWFYLW
jgi:tetratricopeptide (TPR) repeat protein